MCEKKKWPTTAALAALSMRDQRYESTDTAVVPGGFMPIGRTVSHSSLAFISMNDGDTHCWCLKTSVGCRPEVRFYRHCCM